MKSKKNLIVTLADSNYIKQAKHLFCSLYLNSGWEGDFMLLAHEVPEIELRWFRKKGILIKKVGKFYNGKIEGWPPIVLSKFYLFTPYFWRWDKVIYLDADMAVFSSLDNLLKVKKFAAVRGWAHISNLFFTRLSITARGMNKKIFLDLERRYNLRETSFRSSVMVFDPKAIEKNAFLELEKLFKKYKSIAYGDEAIINLLFYRRWVELPQVYNIDPYLGYNLKKVLNGYLIGIIFHFSKKASKKNDPLHYLWNQNLQYCDEKKKEKKQVLREDLLLSERLLKKGQSSLYAKAFNINHWFDMHIGLLGILLKRKTPSIYYFLIKHLK